MLGVDLFLSIALKLMSTSLVYERSWILTLTPRRKKKLERKEKKESKTDGKNTKSTKLY